MEMAQTLGERLARRARWHCSAPPFWPFMAGRRCGTGLWSAPALPALSGLACWALAVRWLARGLLAKRLSKY
jgi:hypothetical protein